MAVKLPKGRDVRFLSKKELGLPYKEKSVNVVEPKPEPEQETVESVTENLSDILMEFRKKDIMIIADHFNIFYEPSWRKAIIADSVANSDKNIPHDRDELTAIIKQG